MAFVTKTATKSSASARFVKTNTGNKKPNPTTARGVRVGVNGCKSKRAASNVKASY